jgi:hypothetical protein
VITAMTEDDKTQGKIAVDEILDGPGDFYYPFADLRLHNLPAKLRITRELQDAMATAMENPSLTGDAFACGGIGLCLWAIQELESELVALREERSGGQA